MKGAIAEIYIVSGSLPRGEKCDELAREKLQGAIMKG